MTPWDLLVAGAHACGLDLVSRAGQLCFADGGQLHVWIPATPLEREFAQALAQALRPWRCPWCSGPAELPDGCSRCVLALAHYSRAGARFPRGATVAHAYRDFTHAACGVTLAALPDALPYTRTELPPGTLCRRCLAALVREHHDAASPPWGPA